METMTEKTPVATTDATLSAPSSSLASEKPDDGTPDKREATGPYLEPEIDCVAKPANVDHLKIANSRD